MKNILFSFHESLKLDGLEFAIVGFGSTWITFFDSLPIILVPRYNAERDFSGYAVLKPTNFDFLNTYEKWIANSHILKKIAEDQWGVTKEAFKPVDGHEMQRLVFQALADEVSDTVQAELLGET